MTQEFKQNRKNVRLIICLFYLFFYLFVVNSIHAQVTIGSGKEPAKGALLDLKENEAPNGDATCTKGIIFPRVNLANLTSLVPLLSATDAADATQKTTHRGSIVYNIKVSAADNLQEGLYCWDGTKWVKVAGNTNDAWLTTGNTGTVAASNYIGTSDNTSLRIDTNGKERIRVANDVYTSTPNPNNAANGAVGIRSEATSGSLTPTSTLVVDGSYAGRYVVVTDNYTIQHTDYNVILGKNPSGSTTPRKVTFTLPAIAAGSGNLKGREYQIKNISDIDTVYIQTGNTSTESIRFGGGVSNLTSRALNPGNYVRITATEQAPGSAGSPNPTWDWNFVATVSPPNVKTIQYTKKIISPITSTANQTVAEIGNLQIRYDGSSSPGFIEIKTKIQTHYSWIFHKAGGGAANIEYYGTNQTGDPANTWTRLNWTSSSTGAADNPANFNANNRDFGVLTIALHNTKEVYRVTFNANGDIAANNKIPATQSSVTIFMEKLD